jgi:hypothetical protein
MFCFLAGFWEFPLHSLLSKCSANAQQMLSSVLYNAMQLPVPHNANQLESLTILHNSLETKKLTQKHAASHTSFNFMASAYSVRLFGDFGEYWLKQDCN